MTTQRRGAAMLAALCGVVLPLTACSEKRQAQLPPRLETSPGASAATGELGPSELLVIHFEFLTITVKPGTKVIGKDGDAAEHTITSKQAGLFDVTVSKGETSSFTAPSVPGSYALICRFHPAMAGTLIVKA